ncbi:hypothetical protein AGR1B_pa0276 [Agrobacterium fabacearum S56]|nr:hypothetical protein AGR1B_pa0276 [Agrobacterium fabacearum S56]
MVKRPSFHHQFLKPFSAWSVLGQISVRPPVIPPDWTAFSKGNFGCIHFLSSYGHCWRTARCTVIESLTISIAVKRRISYLPEIHRIRALASKLVGGSFPIKTFILSGLRKSKISHLPVRCASVA